MRRLVPLLLTLTLAGGASAQPTSGPSPQPSATPGARAVNTSELLRLINAGRKEDELVLAEKVRFVPISLCNAVVVGYVTDNQECLVGSVILDGSRVLSPKQASLEMLKRSGWDQAAPGERERLAREWIEQVLLAFGEQIAQTAPKKFPKENGKSLWSAPRVQSQPAGGVTLLVWIQEPMSTRAATQAYRKSIFTFSPTGELERARMLEKLIIDL